MLTIDPEEGLTRFLERILAAAAAVVSDLRESPCYVVAMELPRMRGLSIAGLDKLFEPEIRASGKWHGRGRAVAVDQDAIYARAFAVARSEGLDERQSDRLARLELAGVVLHELAHAITNGGDGADGVLTDGPEIGRAGFAAFLADAPLPERFKVTPPIVPWHGHAVDFARCCALLIARMSDLLPLRFGDIMPTEDYGLAAPQFYARAMQADGDFDRGGRIRDILDERPGDILCGRWRTDIFRWYQKTPMGPAETAAAEKALALAPC
jgi:hypothetical protein